MFAARVRRSAGTGRRVKTPRANRKTEGRIRVGKIIGKRYRFVDDYKKSVYVGANGKSKERLTYIGQWVCPLNEENEFLRIILISRIAVGVAVATLIAALVVMPGSLSNKWYLPVAAAAAFPLAYAIMGAFAMPNRKQPMERMKYHKSFERSKSAAVAALVILGLSALVWGVCWILAGSGVLRIDVGFGWYEIVFIVCVLVCAAANLVIVRKTKEIKTELRDNGSYKPE